MSKDKIAMDSMAFKRCIPPREMPKPSIPERTKSPGTDKDEVRYDMN